MPKRPFHKRVSQYFGRRGGILTLFGACWVILGTGFALIDQDRFSRPGYDGVLQWLDSMPFPGLFWLACGLIALINGLIRRRVNNEDAVGYAALIMPPLLWVFGYALSFAVWLATMNDPETYGRSSGFLGVLVFGVMVIIIRIVANWTDDLDVKDAIEKKIGSGELALLDRMVETRSENTARGDRARDESERWIKQARIETEQHIEASAAENDRMIQFTKDEEELGRANNERREQE